MMNRPSSYFYVLLCGILMFFRYDKLFYAFCGVPVFMTIGFHSCKNGKSTKTQFEKFFNGFVVGGHRGSPRKAPENSIPAFEKSKFEGCDLVEFDIQLSSDKIPILMHDDDTGRTSAIDVQVAQTSSEILLKTELKPVENVTARIPSLLETVDWCVQNNMKMLFDVKDFSSTMVEKLVSLVQQKNLYDSVIISSFNPYVPYLIKKADEKILTGYTHRQGQFGYVNEDMTEPRAGWHTQWMLEILDDINLFLLRSFVLPRFLGVDMLLLNHRDINAQLKEEAESLGMKLVAWTVNDPSEAKWMADVVKIPYLTDVPADTIFKKN